MDIPNKELSRKPVQVPVSTRSPGQLSVFQKDVVNTYSILFRRLKHINDSVQTWCLIANAVRIKATMLKRSSIVTGIEMAYIRAGMDSWQPCSEPATTNATFYFPN